MSEKGFKMYGSFTAYQGGQVPAVFEAFVENDGEFVVTTTVNGVETARVIIPENVALALADLFDRDATAMSTVALASSARDRA